ncbi:hypothetical protein SAV14893_029560 [Streptomyces avermitilis]|uniref:Uncharacterized protein n=1 Tax=Streptomyces avermitilis TaxID=33903 RepID=A0A4D4LZ00_STRAX|nr:hypothetical protein SAV14893_029560 [Streptomyces avermitilis]
MEGDFLLAVEAQGKKDLDKPHSWAYYLAHLYAKYKLPPVLLVVCQDRNTAAWAALPVDIGPPEWPALTVRPLVLGRTTCLWSAPRPKPPATSRWPSSPPCCTAETGVSMRY